MRATKASSTRGSASSPSFTTRWAVAALAATAVLAVTAAGCKAERAAEKPASEPAQPPSRPAETAGAAVPAAPAAPPAATTEPEAAAAAPPASPASPAASSVPATARQLIVGVVDGWDAVPVQLARYERSSDGGAWKPAGPAWTGVVGSGVAWGRGLHGEGPPAGQTGPEKQEGDGRSPAGVFALNGSYGYAKAPPAGARWSYTPVDASWHCVDDSASKVYGTIVDADQVAKDWSSSEKMRRKDALYTWVVDVAHNPAHVAKGGSCIFLHVWRSESSPTVGCTAMPQPALERVLTWLDPAAHPVYVLLPSEAYAALAAGWGLPAR